MKHISPLPTLLLLLAAGIFGPQAQGQVWSVADIGSSSPTTSISSDAIQITTSAAGFQGTGDSVSFVHTPCGRGGSIEWETAVPAADGLLGIMIRADSQPTSAFAFAGVRKAGSTVSHRFIYRVAAGVEAVEDREISILTGARVRLEVVGNSVFLLTKTGSDEWVRHWGIDLHDPPTGRQMGIDLLDAQGALVTGCLMGVAAASEASLSSADMEISLENDQLVLVEKETGVRWSRLLEPRIGDVSGRVGMVNYSDTFSSSGWASQAEVGYTGSDYAITIMSGDSNFASFTSTDNPQTLKKISVYVRYANVANPINTVMITADVDGVPMPDKEMIPAHTAGLWAHAGDLMPRQTDSSNCLNISVSSSGTGNFGFDGILLIANDVDEDSNNNNLPDHLETIVDQDFLPYNDSDGDGWSDYQEVMYGGSLTLIGWLYPVLSIPVGAEKQFVAYNHWSQTLEVVVTYTGSNQSAPLYGTPIVGFPLSFFVSSHHFLLSPNRHSIPQASTLAVRTNAGGVAHCNVWLAGTSGHMDAFTGVVQANSSVYVNAVQWEIKAYENHLPGPVDAAASSELLAATGQTSTLPVYQTDHTAIAIKGHLMAEGLPDQQHPGVTETTGYVEIRRWDVEAGVWRPLQTLAPPDTSYPFYNFGIMVRFAKVAGEDALVVASHGALFFYTFDANGALDPVPASDLQTLMFSQLFSFAVDDTLLVVGNPSASGSEGEVKIYTWDGIGMKWITSQTLTPTASGHTDRFGTSVAISPDGTRIAVGAPSDMAFWYSPSSQGHYETIFVPGHEEVVGYDEYGNPIYEWISEYYEEVWIEPDPPPATPSVYVYHHPSSEWELEGGRVESATSYNAFGTSVLFEQGGRLLVGAPEVLDTTYGYPFGVAGGYIAAYQHTGSNWSFLHICQRSVPDFGKIIVEGGGVIYSHGPSITLASGEVLPEVVSAIALGTGYFTTKYDYYPSAPVFAVAAAERSLLLRGESQIQEHQWLPSVAFNAAQQTTVATLTVSDADATSSPFPGEFTETTTLSSLSTGTGLEVSATSPAHTFLLKVGDENDLAAHAGEVAWLQLRSLDAAGDAYHEALGVRVVGSAPGVPSGLAVSVLGRDTAKLSWNGLSLEPSAYVLERAYQYELDVAQGDPELIEAAFSEIKRTSGWNHSALDKVETLSSDNLVYRIRAQNNEGSSDWSSLVSIDFDSDEDGIADWWEMLFGGMNFDSTSNSDGDAWTDLEEFGYGTNPLIADSDGDGVDDDVDSNATDLNYNTVGLLLHTELAFNP